MTSCFCGKDATATCQGPCGRRICDVHAIQENSLRGYARPNDALLARLPALELVAKFGYGSGRGARCPECRERAARKAVEAIPHAEPAGYVEKRLWQYENFGVFEPFDRDETWGASYAAVALERAVGHGTFDLSHRRWQPGPVPTVGDVPVWRFTKYVPAEGGGGDETYLQLDSSGRSPVWTRSERRGLLRRGHEVTIDWRPGPADDRSRYFKTFDYEGVVASLTDHRMRGPGAPDDDRSWIGAEPESIFGWLMSRSAS